MTSVAVVVLDTLRKDAFNQHFGWLHGCAFTEAYSTSHWTIPAHGSLFTGLYPSEIGAHAKSQALDCPQPTIAEKASAAGYTTRFWCGNENLTFWDGWRRGFDEFYGPSQLHPKFEESTAWISYLKEIDAHSWTKYPKAVWHAIESDEPTIGAVQSGYRQLTRSDADGGSTDALKRARRTDFDEDELLVVNLMETHAPYHAPDGGGPVNVVIGDAFSDSVENPKRIRRAYDASAKILSKRYETLFDELYPEFDYVLTLSDHGELLGEHGMWNHGYGLYPELVEVPLVLSGDGVEEETVDRPVSVLDVHRTIADLAGVGASGRGESLLDLTGEDEYLTEYEGFVPMHRKQFERKGVSEGIFEEHDTPLRGIVSRSGSYAYQRHGEAFPEAAGETLEELRADLDERNSPSEESHVSDSVQRRLEDLGYA
jgi:arylsulfatase